MINLRYHIVSLTAVFLAIGIGLTLGSTFLDRATVENLNGQLESLETRLGDRDARIGELETDLSDAEELQAALGDQLLTSGSFSPDTLDAQVVFDDGSIQEWVDATYGEGLVTVTSAPEPVG